MLFEINTSNFARHLKNAALSDFAPSLSGLVVEAGRELNLSYRERVFTPWITLYAFLSQVFNDDSSCRRAVMEVARMRKSKQKNPCSIATGAFCQAKDRLPLLLIQRLVKAVVACLQSSEKSIWQHGRVIVVDGTGFSMPDTKENAAKFTRHAATTHKRTKKKSKSSREEKVAFPVGRLVAAFSLATGAVIDLAISTWKGKGTGEVTQLTELWPSFKPGDTLLGDALFSSYTVIASALRRGCHVVSEFKKSSYHRINTRRKDQLINLTKAAYRKSSSLSKADYDALPEEITVRVVKLVCAPAGFRPKVKFIITTHLDSDLISIEDLHELYKQRWQAELNLRSIKTVLGMDVVRSKTPEMVIKEVWVHILAYNLIRRKMAEVAAQKQCPVAMVSFRATQQALTIARGLNACGIKVTEENIVELLVSEEVGKRPGRYEPRTIKRRPKGYKLMTEPRALAKHKFYKKRKK